MLNSLICGTSNLPEAEHNIETLIAPCSKSTPKKHKKSKDSKNPYSDRGLEKFYALLDELESKKQKIYTQKGSQDISFVRFVYSSSDDWKPIVVKAKERTQAQNQGMKTKIIATANSEEKKDKRLIEGSDTVEEIKGSAGSRSNFKIENFKEPSWYMPLMIVLILLFLIIYGKTLAIVCSSIGWYLIPTIKASSPGSSLSSSSDDPKLRKKNVVGKESTSPRSVLLSASEEQSSAGHANRKSWCK